MASLVKGSGSVNQNISSAIERNYTSKNPNSKAYIYEIYGRMEIPSMKDDEKNDITEYIAEFKINDLFDKADFSFCNLTLVMPSDLLRSLQNDYRNSKIVLSMVRYDNLDRSVDRKPEEVWKDKKFVIMDLPKGNLSEDRSGSDPTSISNYGGSITRISVTLIEEEAFLVNRKIYNFVANDATLGNIIQHLIGESIQDKKIIVGKPSNNGNYEQIFIPPMNFTEVLKYLDTSYGVYKNGINYYIGINDLIICDKVDKVKGKSEKIETLNITSQDSTYKGLDSGYFKSTFKDNEKGEAILYTNNRPVINISDMTLKELNGEDINIISKYTSYDLKGGGGVKSNKPPKERYFWSKSTRNDLGSALSMEINENVEYISAVIENSDFELFDIAKKVKLTFPYEVNKDYSGTYRIASANHIFTPIEEHIDKRDNGRKLKLFTKVEFLRI